MKHKELYNYIREEIVNELTISEASPEEIKAKLLIITNASADITELTKQLSLEKDPKKKLELQAKLLVLKNDLAKAKEIKESELEEARKANNLKVSNQEKFNEAKNLYEGSWIETFLNAVEEAGEEGISQKDLAKKVNKKDSANINPLIQEFIEVGIITLTRIKSEEPEVEEPEVEEPTSLSSDYFISDEDEESKDKEEQLPIDSDEEKDDKAYKGAKKISDKEIKKDNEKIIKKNKNNELVDIIIGKIKNLKGDEKAKKIAALKSFINNKNNSFSTSERDNILKRL